jgi:dienelactone hydrolase
MQHWPIKPLLTDDHNQPITTPQAWQAKADRIRTLFQKTLGPRPPSQHYRNYKLLDAQHQGPITLQRVSIQLDDNEHMEAFVLIPDKPNGKAALAMHQTTDNGKDELVGLIGDPNMAYAKELALRGWTVVAPDLFAITRRLPAGIKSYETAPLYQRFPDWSAIGKTVSDLQITLDFMEHFPATKSLPVSSIGHSLGGHAVMFLSVMDPRPTRFVCNGGFYPFADSALRAHFFRDHWYIYLKHPGLKQSVIHGPQPLWDVHELIASTAPRPAMIIAAGNDNHIMSNHALTQMTRELHDLYAFAAPKQSFAAILHNDAHTFLPWHRQAAYAWLES